MCQIAPFEDPSRRIPIRAAVLDLLALAAPMPAALGAPDPEEHEFLETLRRIVARRRPRSSGTNIMRRAATASGGSSPRATTEPAGRAAPGAASGPEPAVSPGHGRVGDLDPLDAVDLDDGGAVAGLAVTSSVGSGDQTSPRPKASTRSKPSGKVTTTSTLPSSACWIA